MNSTFSAHPTPYADLNDVLKQPHWVGLIDRARDGRPDPARSVREPANPDDFKAMLAFVRYVIEKSEHVVPDLDLEERHLVK